MKYELIKCSGEGWSKLFDSEAELMQELLSHVCRLCLEGEIIKFNDGRTYTIPPADTKSIGGLLSTACGCEYKVYRWIAKDSLWVRIRSVCSGENASRL